MGPAAPSSSPEGEPATEWSQFQLEEARHLEPHAAAVQRGCSVLCQLRVPLPVHNTGGSTPLSIATSPSTSACLPPCPACSLHSDPRINTTRCLANFELTCDKQRGCSGCALWAEVEQCGTPQQREECVARGSYVMFRAVESDAATGLPCQTLNHWMVMPRIPCTGVESPDPACESEFQSKLACVRCLAHGVGSSGSVSSAGVRRCPHTQALKRGCSLPALFQFRTRARAPPPDRHRPARRAVVVAGICRGHTKPRLLPCRQCDAVGRWVVQRGVDSSTCRPIWLCFPICMPTSVKGICATAPTAMHPRSHGGQRSPPIPAPDAPSHR